MMHGTLEVKQEALTAEAVKRPEWMDEEIAADAITEEQRKVRKKKRAMPCRAQKEKSSYEGRSI